MSGPPVVGASTHVAVQVKKPVDSASQPVGNAITSYLNVFMPKVLLEVNGELATDLAHDLVKFELIEGGNKMMEAHFHFHDKGHKYVTDKRLHTHGVPMVFRWGYPGDFSDKFTTVITRAKPSFPKSGMPMIESIAFDPRVVMDKMSSAKNWGRVSSSKIAEQIADLYGFKKDIEESADNTKEAKVQPASSSDILFLLKLADKVNFACYIDEKNTLHYHPHRVKSDPTLDFWYFSNNLSTILSFVPKVKMEKGGPKKTGANAKTGSAIEEAIKTDAKGGDGTFNMHVTFLPSATHMKLKVNPKKPVGDPSTNTDAKVADKLAGAAMQKIDMSAVTATATVIGTPRLRAYKVITLNGLGGIYSGKWYVVKVRHVIQPTGDIYVCDLDLSRTDPKAQKKGATTDATKDKAPDGTTKNSTKGLVVIAERSGTAIPGYAGQFAVLLPEKPK